MIFSTRKWSIRIAVGRLALGAFLLESLYAPTAHAATLGQLMGMDSFKRLVLTIAMVNKSMKDAAENPMDEWRRANVQKAISLMPAAIVGLAKDFQAGKLHDQDLPFVQSLLGGFVDVSAPDNYKKFMKSPSSALIPQSGTLPKSYLENAPEVPNASRPSTAVGAKGNHSPSRIDYDESAPKNQKSVSEIGKNLSGEVKAGEDVLSLGQTTLGQLEKLEKSSQKTSSEVEASYERAAQNTSSTSQEVYTRASASQEIASPKEASLAAAVNPAQDLQTTKIIQKAQGDLNQISEQMEQRGLSSTLDADFFKARKKNKKPETPKKEEKQRPTSFLKISTEFLVAAFLGSEVHAEAAAPPGAPAGAGAGAGQGQQGGGDCPSCKGGGGGGGGGGEGGGGSGKNAAEMLFGIAAILASVMPALAQMSVAKTQAEADKEIARINSDTQKYMTDKTQNTALQQAKMQTDVAVFQANTTRQVNIETNQFQSQRLQEQLAQLEKARTQTAEAEERRRQMDERMADKRIELAKQTAENNQKFAMETLNAQVTQAGFQSGSINSMNSADRLTVSRSLNGTSGTEIPSSGLGRTLASTASTSSGGSALGLSRRTGLGVMGEDGLTAQASAGGSPFAGKIIGSRGMTSNLSAKGFFEGVDGDQPEDPPLAKKRRRGVRNGTTSRRSSYNPNRGVLNYMKKEEGARGVTAPIKPATSSTKPSDLVGFATQGKTETK